MEGMGRVGEKMLRTCSLQWGSNWRGGGVLPKSMTQQDIDDMNLKPLSGPWCKILPSVLVVKQESDSDLGC